MRNSGRKLNRSGWAVIFLAAVLAGCAASTRFHAPADNKDLAADVLHRYLDRWVGWQSLTSRVKITVSNGDTTVSARGHLVYMLGERFELGFERPYNRFLGNLYVTPDQTIYWNLNSVPQVLTTKDTTTLASLVRINVPNWDPRDLLPFPMSGRTSGLQPDSAWREDNRLRITATSEGVAYRMDVSMTSGCVEREWISRTGRAPLLKIYRRTRDINGWPVPVRVTCTDSTGRFSISWSLREVFLKSEPFNLPSDSLAPRKSG